MIYGDGNMAHQKAKGDTRRRVWVRALILTAALAMALCSCKQHQTGTFSMEDFAANTGGKSRAYTFSAPANDKLLYDAGQLDDFQNSLRALSVDYGYEELFDCEKGIEGICVDHSAAVHQYSALDEGGYLTKEHLLALVKENNAAYLQDGAGFARAIEDDELLLRICEIIVDTVRDMLEEYPDIDRNRVFCNLGNLKILERPGALNFAAVEPDMVLHVNRNTANLASLTSSGTMYNVLLHESMHILQYGCSCERIAGCTRRCGYAHYYPEWEQNYADLVWLAEGSAERMACLYANTEPMTYQTLVNYIRSLDLSVVLRDELDAHCVETLSFYADTDRLFAAFGAREDGARQEIYQMLYALEIVQSAPADVKQAYEKYYGCEWSEEVRVEVNKQLRRPVVMTLTKCFYNSISQAVQQHDLTKNDVMFLVNLFESAINAHLCMDDPRYDEYNTAFVPWYTALRENFFSCLENISLKDYISYHACVEETTVNAGLDWLTPDKKDFLLEVFEANLCDYKVNES